MTFFERPIGIDLGTTNSEVALLEPSEREIFVYQDRHKRKTVPSAIAWDAESQSLLVGRPARMRRGRNPGPIESIKRKMGQNTTVSCGPHELKPEEVSGKILAELAARMREYLSEKSQGGVEMRVQRAVITVPAYFDAPQVEATRRAAELAGLDPIGILQEPTAAAIYHTWKRKLGDGVFLVYDFGGGTFDVSVLRCVGGEYQVLAIDGDNYLGGDDLDRRFAEHLRKDLAERGYALDLDVLGDADDRRRFTQLVHLAQEIKESLSTRDVVHVQKQGIVDDKKNEPVDYEGEVSRADYERVVGDLVETTITCAERALEQSKERASIGIEDIDNVILVGGSTRVPLVIRRVTEKLCARSKCPEPLQDEVDTCVALGAAIHAAQIGGLRIGDEHAQVLFTSALVTKSSPLKLGLRIEKAPAGVKEISIRSGGEEIAGAPAQLNAVSPLRLAVPLGEQPEQPLTLAFKNDDGEVVATLPFAVYRGDVRPRASALSRPAVVAKDLSVEVVRAGRRDRRVLLPRGTGLPMKVSQTFFTADQSGAVVLRLLQGRMPIKTLVLAVPGEIPVGTAVELDIRCDEAMRLEARANVAGHELWATIEAPETPKFDPKGNVEQLLEDAEETRRALWGVRGDAYRREADALTAGIREVVATDPDKLAVLCERLRRLVDEFRPDDTAGGLAPPLHHFEYELNSLRRVVYRASGPLMGMDRNGWEERIKDIETRAQAAYEEVDAVAWRRIYNEVQALRETAHQEEFAALRLDDPAYVARRLLGAVARANEVERDLRDFVPAQAEEVKALQLAERDRLLGQLDSKVSAVLGKITSAESDPNGVRRQLEQIASELDRIEMAIERIPSLGVVAEHGGGGGGHGGR
jgi:molecular chaperone DnaK